MALKITQKAVPAVLLLVLLCLMIIASTIGSANIPLSDVARIVISPIFPGADDGVKQSFKIIIRMVRLPRVLLSVLAGMGLAISGAVFQGIFRNPMANPYILGVSSGAAFGATLGMILGLQITFLGVGAVPLSAFIGAIGASLLVYILSGGGKSVMPLLLSGIALGFFLTALMSLLMYFNRDQLERIVYWSMGSFNAANWTKVALTAPVILSGGIVILFFARDLNLMVLGDDTARGLGIPVRYSRIIFLLTSTIITASAVSVSGIIGFVGLIIPHIIRIITGPDHRTLIPNSMLAGGIFLLLSDTLARTVLSPTEIPVGIITSLAGAPYFLLLLYQRRKQFI
ncbi:MAG: iron ABC transporter permease [Spirochaetales bacterium]|nr:iron ABC transporter permease [Spirochaetales bacterium]